MAPAEASVLFFLQMAVIIGVCRVIGSGAKRFLGQPQVVGEMIAGVVIGPSVLGLFAPEFQGWLFPKETHTVLFVVAQLGIGIYMFLVGLGFNVSHFKANARSAAAVSLSGIAAPFLVAVVMTPWLLTTPGLFSASVTTGQATLFLGACIAITAFPMLARIVHERGLSHSPLGTLALAAGAVDDAGAWIVLAIVLASMGAGASLAISAIVGGFTFVILMVTVGRKLLQPLGVIAEREGALNQTVLAITLCVLMLCVCAMDAAGLHAVFGGFILGTVMPRGFFARELRRRLEPFVMAALLPVFFCYSGLNTQLAVVHTLPLLLVALAILGASIVAKGVACWGAARLTGHDNTTAMGIGALMNARGLMELIIINIGLQRGIISTTLFSMLVLMTVVTTLMASPLFEWFYGTRARQMGTLVALAEGDELFPEETAPSNRD